MDEQLINEYINNLANQVNSLTQENILLKTRLNVFERREQERLSKEAEEKVEEKQEELQEEVEEPEAPVYEDSSMTIETQPEPEPKQDLPPLVRGPKPKGYNPKVDGPRPLIPNPKIAEE